MTLNRLVDLAFTPARLMGLDSMGNYIYAKVLEYPVGDGIDWHHDHGTSRTSSEEAALIAAGEMERWQIDEMNGRIVSVMVQLSDPHDYEGGDLTIRAYGTETLASRERGAATVITATTEHRVSPITAGTRLSLVAFLGWSPRG